MNEDTVQFCMNQMNVDTVQFCMNQMNVDTVQFIRCLIKQICFVDKTNFSVLKSSFHGNRRETKTNT